MRGRILPEMKEAEPESPRRARSAKGGGKARQ
jgi:hypothetical protein